MDALRVLQNIAANVQPHDEHCEYHTKHKYSNCDCEVDGCYLIEEFYRVLRDLEKQEGDCK